MKLVRVRGRWGSVSNVSVDRDTVVNVESITRITEPSPGAFVGLHFADGHVLYASHVELRRILKATGATMPPRPTRPK